MVDRVFFAKTGHTIFIPKATVVRRELFLSIKCHPTTETVGWFLLLFLYPRNRKKSCAEFIQVQEIPEKKLWGFSCCRPAENQRSFYRFHTDITSHHRKDVTFITSITISTLATRLDLDQSSCTSCTVRMGNVTLHGSQPQSTGRMWITVDPWMPIAVYIYI